MPQTCKRRPGGGGAADTSLAGDVPQSIKSSYVTPAAIPKPEHLRELHRRLDALVSLPLTARRERVLWQEARR